MNGKPFGTTTFKVYYNGEIKWRDWEKNDFVFPENNKQIINSIKISRENTKNGARIESEILIEQNGTKRKKKNKAKNIIGSAPQAKPGQFIFHIT